MTFKDLKLKINDLLEKIIESDRYLYELIGEAAIKIIKIRTRLGYGVNEPCGDKVRLAPFGEKAADPQAAKKKYVKFRKNFSNLSSETTPGKSNLTLTGDMLDNMTYKATRDGVTITFDGNDNKKKAQWAQEGSSNRPQRIFLNLSASEKKQIGKEIRDYLVDKINKKL